MEDSGVRKKSVSDIYDQAERIANYYGDDSPRTQRADQAAIRYVENIYATPQSKRIGEEWSRAMTTGNKSTDFSRRLNQTKYSRSTYMGLSNG